MFCVKNFCARFQEYSLRFDEHFTANRRSIVATFRIIPQLQSTVLISSINEWTYFLVSLVKGRVLLHNFITWMSKHTIITRNMKHKPAINRSIVQRWMSEVSTTAISEVAETFSLKNSKTLSEKGLSWRNKFFSSDQFQRWEL